MSCTSCQYPKVSISDLVPGHHFLDILFRICPFPVIKIDISHYKTFCATPTAFLPLLQNNVPSCYLVSDTIGFLVSLSQEGLFPVDCSHQKLLFSPSTDLEPYSSRQLVHEIPLHQYLHPQFDQHYQSEVAQALHGISTNQFVSFNVHLIIFNIF